MKKPDWIKKVKYGNEFGFFKKMFNCKTVIAPVKILKNVPYRILFLNINVFRLTINKTRSSIIVNALITNIRVKTHGANLLYEGEKRDGF